MKAEDLKAIPDSVQGWQVVELLRTLRITEWKNVQELVFEPGRIRATVLATDENGKYYLTGPQGDTVATHEISIRIEGSWERPEDGARPVCTNHVPVQHRDGKEPWCRACGLNDAGTEPQSRFDRP